MKSTPKPTPPDAPQSGYKAVDRVFTPKPLPMCTPKGKTPSVAPNGTPRVKHHNETIVCPECNAIEHATVMHTVPWYSYVHECTKCGYIVMESDWTLAELKETP